MTKRRTLRQVGSLLILTPLLLMACTKHAPDRSCESPSQCRHECDVGGMGSCSRLAMSMMAGLGGERRDLKGAIALLDRACNADEAVACMTLSGQYRSGIGVIPDRGTADRLLDKAIRRFEAECKSGDADSCYTLYTIRATGPGRVNNRDEAERLLERTVGLAREECTTQHRPVSCRILAGSVEALPDHGLNNPEYLVRLEDACDGGSAAACRDRADQVWFGVGGQKDEDRARRYFERALTLLKQQCDAGVADRCVLLGAWIGTDHRFLKEPRDNAAAYTKACDLGDPVGCVYAGPNVGRAFGDRPADTKRGDELERKGLEILSAACDDGWALSCLELTTRILVRIDGDRAVAQDHPRYLAAYKRGIKLLEQDCENDDRSACRTLGDDLSAEGKFGPKIHVDLAKAKHAYERACAIGGDPSACEKGEKITPPPQPSEPPKLIEVPLPVPTPSASASSAPPIAPAP